MIRKLFIICVIIFLFIPLKGFAHTDVDYTNLGKTIRYVRDGASGENDGTSWVDAYEDTDDFTATRDYVYFIADGAYLADTLGVADSGSNYIYYVKAVSDDHGSETGWDSAYGDGVATFTGTLNFTTSYYIFDGQNGGGPTAWRTGHGFKFEPTGCTDSSSTFIIIAWNDALDPSYIEFHHIEMEHCGEDYLAIGGGAGDQSINNLWNIHYWTWDHCWMHDADTTIFKIYQDCNDVTIEYCCIEKRHTVSAVHGENIMFASNAATVNFTFRYNLLQDSAGSGMLYFDNRNHAGPSYIYGNIFYQSSDRYWTSNGMLGTSSGSYTYSDINAWNNTFVNGYDSGGTFTQSCIGTNDVGGTGFVARNNICINSADINANVDTRSHNLFDSQAEADNDDSDGQYYAGAIGDLLTDYTNYDFTLKIATDDGSDLGSPYNADPTGAIRGADSVWDRGAYEFGASAALTGTLSDNANESDIVTGGQTLIITLTGNTWDANVGSDHQDTVDLIAGLDSGGAEAAGWDAVVKANLVYTDITRDSDTQVTILLGAEATYSITATETITVTIPASCLTNAVEIVATQTFNIYDSPVASGWYGTFTGLTIE